mmetsp:Transcript_42484/g.51552  ORF Transcript_42484/g.51552 Transcript_42484/m.51552 type:complete len:451 (+) Transcript_42484:121-1473(+)|eukprot:CAMPEP_0197855046 /NCGR_PEP_ID=MMETSP1438-20131217/25868_1 /TAXON_ID=1461541 /ORGANISM="Pterosperma sp., Strain CCMP1384" /LENGTH=450 /DNA_ID=CAMNT_0043470019 /DNA_START=119 /DNA_END=1471 /DNA_ORIENTATION=-
MPGPAYPELVPGVPLSPVVCSLWLPDTANGMLGILPPPPEGEEAPEPPEPTGPSKDTLFDMIPTRLRQSAAMHNFNEQKKKILTAEAEFGTLTAENPQDLATLKEEKSKEIDALKEALPDIEAKYAEFKGSFEAEATTTMPWMHTLLSLADAGVSTFSVGGTFWPTTDMLRLFGSSDTLYKESETILGVFKKRYDVEREQAMTIVTRLVPNVFQMGPESPFDMNAAIDTILGSLYPGFDPEDPPQLDVLTLHWWDVSTGDYVAACKELMATGKVKALGLSHFPVAAQKQVLRAGINVALVEGSYPLGATEDSTTKSSINFCVSNGMKVLASNALLGGLISSKYVGKLNCPGDGFTEPIDTTGPMAEGVLMIRNFGGWEKFQELLTTLDGIGKKKGVSLEAVALKYYLTKGLTPVVIVPWDSAAELPSLSKLSEDFLDAADLEKLAKAFKV